MRASRAPAGRCDCAFTDFLKAWPEIAPAEGTGAIQGRVQDDHGSPLPSATVTVTFPREDWLPIIPSFGVSYKF